MPRFDLSILGAQGENTLNINSVCLEHKMCIRDVREQQAAFPGSYVVYEERGPETLWGYRFYI